jgi:hypothetical protein
MQRLEQANVKARLRMRAVLGIAPDEEPTQAEGWFSDATPMFAGTDLSGPGVLECIRSAGESQEVEDDPRAMALALWCFWFGWELGRDHDG